MVEQWEQRNLQTKLPGKVIPAIVAAAEMLSGACRLETALGSVDLNMREQLADIERGFFDLLEHRSRILHDSALAS